MCAKWQKRIKVTLPWELSYKRACKLVWVLIGVGRSWRGSKQHCEASRPSACARRSWGSRGWNLQNFGLFNRVKVRNFICPFLVKWGSSCVSDLREKGSSGKRWASNNKNGIIWLQAGFKTGSIDSSMMRIIYGRAPSIKNASYVLWWRLRCDYSIISFVKCRQCVFLRVLLITFLVKVKTF